MTGPAHGPVPPPAPQSEADVAPPDAPRLSSAESAGSGSGGATAAAPPAATPAPQPVPVASDEDAPPPEPPADEAWAEEPWPPSDPWAAALPQDAGIPERSAPARAVASNAAASAGSEPRGLDLLRSVFAGRVLQVVSDASEAVLERGADSAAAGPVDPDEAALDPEPGGPP